MRFILGSLLAATLALTSMNLSADPASSLYDLKVNSLDGKPVDLAQYKGHVILVVNVASKCGFTPQYAGLEATYQKYKDKGFEVLGFPCNQFKSQEPGTDAEIKQFCSLKYGVTFPLFDKIEVNGPDRNPLYVQLAGTDSPFPGDIKWNFTKFLIGRDGKILARFEPATKPDSPEVASAIDVALNK
jgi:glutathione peroxidase